MTLADFDGLPWTELKRIRESFLSEQALPRDYWSSPELLALYDRSLGERIGWKWQAVMGELKSRGWSSLRPETEVLDWGCGSGQALAAWLAVYPESRRLRVYDRSRAAEEYACKKIQAIQASAELSTGLSTGREGPSLVLLSHVITELPSAVLTGLKKLLSQSGAFVWVEPGTQHVGRLLPVIRDEFLNQGWEALGPCPHQAPPCGLRRPGNERHWCHNFAKTPNHVHHDRFWARVRNELGIDLRRTPYSYLAMRKPGSPLDPWADVAAQPESSGLARLIGEPRNYKGYSKLLLCRRDPVEAAPGRGQGEVGEFTLQKRDAPQLLKDLKDGETSPYLELQFGPDRKIKEPVGNG